MKTKTKGLSSVLGFVTSIGQFVVYLRAVIAAVEAVKDVLTRASNDEND